MAGLYLQVKQIQRRSILCILLTLNQFMWTECSKDSCIFFLLKNVLFLHRLGFNKLHWSQSFQSFRSNGVSTLHLNKQSRAGLETLPTVFPSCQMQVHLSLLRHERSEWEKDGKNCQIFWHRFHGRADILRKKDSVMKLKRRRRILLKSIIISGWIWGAEEEKEKSVGE